MSDSSSTIRPASAVAGSGPEPSALGLPTGPERDGNPRRDESAPLSRRTDVVWPFIRRSILEPLTDLVCPPTCLWCGRELPGQRQGPYFCGNCRQDLFGQPFSQCGRCAMPVSRFWSDLKTGDCPHCRPRPPRYDAAFALGIYRQELGRAVREMKHVAGEPLCESVSMVLAGQLERQRPEWEVDLVTALPMHWRRKLLRRTNPAETVAVGVARRLRREVDCRILQFRRKIRKQGTLTPHQRWQNVSGAFRIAAGYDLRGLRVLLIDDILTTGATAEAATRQLRRAGADHVMVAVVARGTGILPTNSS